MSTATYSVKVAALKGAEIKLTVRSLEKDVVSFCPIFALRLLDGLGAAGPIARANDQDPHATAGELHDYVAECLVSARSTVPKASATFTLVVRDAAWLQGIKKGDGRDTAAYPAPMRRMGAAFVADDAQVVVARDSGAIEAYEVAQKRGRASVGKPTWAAQHLGLRAFTALAEDVLVTLGRAELRAHRDGEPIADLSFETGVQATALAAAGARALIGFDDGSVAAWQPGKDAALVPLGRVEGPVVGLAAVGEDAIAVATAGAVAVLRAGAVASTLPSTDGPITAIAPGLAAGQFVFGTAAGEVVWADVEGTIARKLQTRIQQDCAVGMMHRDASGTLAALARRGGQLFVATLEPEGLRFAGPIAEVDQISSAGASDGLIARVHEDQVLHLGHDGAVRFRQTLPKGAVRAAHMSPPLYEPQVTRDGSGLILGFTEVEKGVALRSPAGVELARGIDWGASHAFSGAVPLGRDAALAWFNNDDAFRLTAAGAEQLAIRIHHAAPIERTGGVFALLREEDRSGRLVELDAEGRELAQLGVVSSDDFLSSGNLLASDDGSLFKADVYDSQRGRHVSRCWLREGAGFREVAAPWGEYESPRFSADGQRVAWTARKDDALVLHDIRAGRELARRTLKNAWLFEFDGAGRLVVESDDRHLWFDAEGRPCGEQTLPAGEVVQPPVTHLLATGSERGVVVVTPLHAFVLAAEGDPQPLPDAAPLAATGKLVAYDHRWPLALADLG
ncbi:hypothetical protein [Nannocystis bainbridge]|uniref:WD40 repeat domain-containing protein n=1 Tax=Nannocystis bainbridge TaxID=2995303 RepID=A0ABT5E2R4_9BACT|nr:hypothetical protein [Nannocystis bainbridge]MDC0719026.1 hypothetical protein [Nannocystis bainbridge]